MSTPFRVLIIGDNSMDKALIEKCLCKSWLVLDLKQVASIQELEKTLVNQSWDCFLCDPSGIDALDALSLLKRTSAKSPFLIIADIECFESSISLLKSGATDFIRRDNLERLVPAIKNALKDAKADNQQSNWVSELRESEHRLGQAQWQALINTLPDLVWLKDRQGIYLACNHRFERYLGVDEEEIIGQSDYDFMDQQLANAYREQDDEAMSSGERCISEEVISFADDGHVEQLETIKVPMYQPDGELMGVLGVSPMYFSAFVISCRFTSSAICDGSGTRLSTVVTISGDVPHVTCGFICAASNLMTASNTASSSLFNVRQ